MHGIVKDVNAGLGMDYEEEALQKSLQAKRAGAILNLITVLEETEKERQNFVEKQEAREKNRAMLRKILG